MVVSIYSFPGKGQIKDSTNKYEPKILEGYFILLRDSIPTTPTDLTLPNLNFDIFYVNTIDDILLQHLRQLNRPKYDSIIFVSSCGSSDISGAQEYKDYINWLIQNKYFEKADKGFSIFDISRMPTFLVNSKRRFASVYEGKCIVVGPFYPNTKLDLKYQII